MRYILIGYLCLDAHLPTRCQHMGICACNARHANQKLSISVPLLILYLFIVNVMEFLKVWSKHNLYYIYGIYQCILSLDMFISFLEASMVISWIRLFFTLWGHRSEKKRGFSTHLVSAVKRVAVKYLTPCGDYKLIGGWLPVSEVEKDTGDRSESS